jgi:uncharacterized protein (TIGR03066 family)
MNVLKYISVAAVVCLIGPTARPDDKPDYAKLIVGKWEVIKAAPDTVPEGEIIEFTMDRKLMASVKKGEEAETFEGKYTLDGDKLKTKVGDKERETITIVKISETEMSTKDEDGKEVVLKRTK